MHFVTSRSNGLNNRAVACVTKELSPDSFIDVGEIGTFLFSDGDQALSSDSGATTPPVDTSWL